MVLQCPGKKALTENEWVDSPQRGRHFGASRLTGDTHLTAPEPDGGNAVPCSTRYHAFELKSKVEPCGNLQHP